MFVSIVCKCTLLFMNEEIIFCFYLPVNVFKDTFLLKIDNQTNVQLTSGQIVWNCVLDIIYICYPIVGTNVFDV